MADTPKNMRKKPYAMEVEAGKSYFWCACGKSSTQPLCDGSHKGTEFAPHKFEATKDGKMMFCGCKKSTTPPLCDGTHGKL
ncbi:CDGSH iron-sulfur domain-containing protein [Sulfitobacter aestuariivivens]|uniref:CDGSH iron-sulfur domain-containing protein n=1 Tax=Sulfitobacter aestuariivivens TaxID=2766981 RepID=A0A927D1B9_9RHOB|nr:CDGSH iron-sulfur domain-containing protein [Sulfitobacter aestuariivivens]MBD3662548.1 CDGSH iron-sulfur domain-containing protein [Sulfitobacter aestuariivivens]